MTDNTAVSKTIPQFSEGDYREIASFADAEALLRGSGVELVTAEDLGDGFSVVENKNQVVGVPFLILDAKMRTGDTGEYVVLRTVTKTNLKLVIVDGGTGLKEQIKGYMETHDGDFPRFAGKGLRVSKYTHEQYGASETFYLDTSA